MANDKTIDVLNKLIEKCKDGEYGFRTSAEHAKAPEVAQLLSTRAQDCARAAHELQAEVARLGGTPDSGGSLGGAMHRGWVSVKSRLTHYSDEAVLEECERGEDSALAVYADALKEPLPDPARTIVDNQYLGVRRNHDLVRDLRDTYRRASAART